MAAVDDWSERADVAEQTILRRYLRRLGGLVPGTRIGRIAWPRRVPVRPYPWHYWWQAHLLDCLVDAQQRSPSPSRAGMVAMLVRGIRVHNVGSWVNRYYDDIAWLGLAVQRAGPLTRPAGPLEAICARLAEGWTEDGGGGLWWRRNDDFKNAPANGPAAILMARLGQVEFASAIADWMADTLVDPDSGLVRDGVRLSQDGSVREVVGMIYTYCQGVHLGCCIELAEHDGHHRFVDRALAVVDAISNRLTLPGGILPGSGGGDGGLFAGITVRYLADAAIRRSELTTAASRLVLDNAAAVWAGRAEVAGGPVFAADWGSRAAVPGPGVPEADLSVQLGAWMALEAAARVQRSG